MKPVLWKGATVKLLRGFLFRTGKNREKRKTRAANQEEKGKGHLRQKAKVLIRKRNASQLSKEGLAPYGTKKKTKRGNHHQNHYKGETLIEAIVPGQG